MSSDGSARPTLLVFCDSLSYYGPQGGVPADDPRIWPNIVAAQLGWDCELIGRIGWTSRDVWWAATQDPRAWAALPRAGAVVFATSGMDSLPSPLPTAARELIRYVRPPLLRRWVREHERDSGQREGMTTAEQQRIKELEREVKELRKANEILKLASAFFAQAELDRRFKL